MKKYMVILAFVLVGCNDQPLPTFVKDSGHDKCRFMYCYGDMPQTEVHMTSSINKYDFPDKHYDSILGHHDYSVEADH